MNDAIRAEAAAIIAAAAKREPVELERLQVFAMACMRESRVFQLGTAIQRGGEFAPRRALELAEHVLTFPRPVPGRALPALGFYYCPVCGQDRPLVEACEHIHFGESMRAKVAELVRTRLGVDDGARCDEHDAPLANEAFFKCGCRYVTPPASVQENDR